MPKLIPAAVAALILAIAPAGAVINGGDSQRDYYEAPDPRLKRMSGAVLALFESRNLAMKGGRYELSLSTFDSVPIANVQFSSEDWDRFIALGLHKVPLCAEERFYGQPRGAFCSSFLVEPDVVATAGHCLDNEAECLRTKFVVGFRMEGKGVFSKLIPRENVYSCKKLLQREYNKVKGDYALVRLDRPLPLEIAPLAIRTEEEPKLGEPMALLGHPHGLPLKIDGFGRVMEVLSPLFLKAGLDTFPGDSGGPLVNLRSYQVEGIHVRGAKDSFVFNGGKGCAEYRIANHPATATRVSRIAPFVRQAPKPRPLRLPSLDGIRSYPQFLPGEELWTGSR